MLDEPMESGISSEDIALAKENARHFDPRVRAKAIGFLAKNGPCSWDDLRSWALDAEGEIRLQALYSIGSGMDAASYLCESDKAKCSGILAAAAERYADLQVGITMCKLAERDAEWLDLTWQIADQLVEHGSEDQRSAMMFGFLERLIPERDWGPDDTHIRSWILSGGVQKKLLLLKIAAFRGLETGRMKEIVEEIARDRDPYIGSLAQGVLEGRVTHSDIPG
jgi:hypothetical protein